MHSFYVVVHHSEMKINQYEKSDDQNPCLSMISLQPGDGLEITNEGYYVQGTGWFILVVLNERTKMFVSFTDLEECMQQNLILNRADIEIKRSLWHNQINQALEKRNEDWFKFVSRKLTSLESIG